MAERNGVNIVLATGGTGGHIYPAVAVGNAARKRGFSAAIVGQEGGMEERIAEEEGFAFHGVPAGRWNRGGLPDPRELWRALQGMLQAPRVVRELNPSVVIGFGGFASYAGASAAVRLNIPLVLHEANTVPSLVNRRLSRRAVLSVLARAEAREHLVGSNEYVVLPYPIREERVSREAALASFGLQPDKPVLLIMGGSQGSVPLNNFAPRVVEQLGAGAVQVLHATGRLWIDDVRAATRDFPDYHAVPYVHAPSAWAVADVAVTRSGMGTITEAAFHGVPLVMVPLPGAADDHQLHNARSREREGAGIVVEQGAGDQATIAALVTAITRVLAPGERARMSEAAQVLNAAGAADDIVGAVVKSVGL